MGINTGYSGIPTYMDLYGVICLPYLPGICTHMHTCAHIRACTHTRTHTCVRTHRVYVYYHSVFYYSWATVKSCRCCHWGTINSCQYQMRLAIYRTWLYLISLETGVCININILSLLGMCTQVIPLSTTYTNTYEIYINIHKYYKKCMNTMKYT